MRINMGRIKCSDRKDTSQHERDEQMTNTINALKDMGFNWERNTVGVKFDNGMWNVNVVLKNEDGSRKPAYGFLKFSTVDEAVEAERCLMES